jgi:hypothetical protein
MPTIVATVGSATANSFVTEAEAIAYAADRLNLPSGWTTVAGSTCTDSEKKALIEATRDLTRLAYDGYRTDDTQVLSWPRNYVVNPDVSVNFQVDVLTRLPYYEDDEIPLRLKEATYELAFEHLRADITQVEARRGLIRDKVDVLEQEWTPGSQPQGLARFPRVMALVAPLLASQGLQVVRS